MSEQRYDGSESIDTLQLSDFFTDEEFESVLAASRLSLADTSDQLSEAEQNYLQFEQQLECDISAIADPQLRSILRRMHNGYPRSTIEET